MKKTVKKKTAPAGPPSERGRRRAVNALALALACSPAASRAATPASPVARAPAVALRPPPEKSSGPFGDFRDAAPGKTHHIRVEDLPPPHQTPSADNGPRVVPRPPKAWPRAPEGFRVNIYAEGLEAPRLLRTSPTGDVFVVESQTGTIKVLRGLDARGHVVEVSTFATGLHKPFGLAFAPEWLYVGETDAVVRFPFRGGDRKARGPAVKVADLPGGGLLRGGGHWTRDLAFSADGQTLYVSVGSFSNNDDPDETPAEALRADILAVSPAGGKPTVFASGIRNAVGLAVQPKTGVLWASVNERDGLGDDLVPDYITAVPAGSFFGWPWFYIGDHQDPRHRGKHPELGARTRVPDVLLQPHFASLELCFYEGSSFPAAYRGDLFAAEHGSWNRKKRTGYEVIRVPFAGGNEATGSYEDFLTGFVTPSGDVWGRPVGVAVAPDGALLVSDDAGGVVWRVSYGPPAAGDKK